MDPSLTIYAALLDINQTLVTGLDAAMYAGLSFSADLMQAAFLPFIIMLGVLMMAGQMGAGVFCSHVGRAALFIALAVGGWYAPYVHDLLITHIPNDIATRLNGAGSTITIDQQFYNAELAMENIAARVSANATGLLSIGKATVIGLIVSAQKIFIGLTFLVFMLGRLSLYMAVAIGAFMLPFLLFTYTRGWILSMLGTAVGLVCWQLGVSIVLSVLLAGMSRYIVRIDAALSGFDIDQQMMLLTSIAAFNLCSLFLVIVTGAVVGSIGSGFASSAAAGAVVAGGRASVAAAAAMQRSARAMRGAR